jgi:hypothetical protein
VLGGYQGFRPHVRVDFEKSCAYCLLAELFAAGEQNFELDHFRPKSLFPALINDFYNLYYACHPCNKIKGAKWPAAELLTQGIGFVDLCKDDFGAHFLERMDGRLEGLTPSARYTIDALCLNNKHLIEIRLLLRPLSIGRGATT